MAPGMGLFLLSINFHLQFCKSLHCKFCYSDPHLTLAYGYFPFYKINTNSSFSLHWLSRLTDQVIPLLMLALEPSGVFWSWSREVLYCDQPCQPFKRYTGFLSRSTEWFSTLYVLVLIGRVTLALSFQAGFLVLYLWSLLFFLPELALLLLASLWVLLKPFPVCCQDGLMTHPSRGIHCYDVNVCGSYYYAIIVDFLCVGMLPGCSSAVPLSTLAWQLMLHGAGQWAEGGKGPWLLSLSVLGVLFQSITDFISQSLCLLTPKQSMWIYCSHSISTRGC